MMAGRLRTACSLKLLPLLRLLALLAAVQAQFNYTTNNGTITITGYTGAGGVVTSRSTINSLPVTSIGGGSFYTCTSLTRATSSNGANSAYPLSKFLSVVTYSHKPNGPCNENT
jgi:hypothetical protein